jgi:hypothetical protein
MQQGRRDRILVGESFGCGAEDGIIAAVEVFPSGTDEAVRLIQVAQLDEEPQRARRLFVVEGEGQGLLLGLEILEIGQPLEMGPQMIGAEDRGKVPPAFLLSVVGAAKRLERCDP